jgi:predicted nucleotidyltransferase
MTKRAKLKSKDRAALEEFLQKVRASLGNNLVEVKLFGSKATGRDQADSDIDVLVVVERGGVETEDQVLDIAFDVNVAHEVYISPRVLSRAVLEDPVWKITPFLRAISKEGIPL